jgi:hypothetical protein
MASHSLPQLILNLEVGDISATSVLAWKLKTGGAVLWTGDLIINYLRYNLTLTFIEAF